MTAGAVLVIAALLLFSRNRAEDRRAGESAEELHESRREKTVMEQMAQKAGPRTKRPRLKNLKLVRPCMMGRKTGTLWMGRIKAA